MRSATLFATGRARARLSALHTREGRAHQQSNYVHAAIVSAERSLSPPQATFGGPAHATKTAVVRSFRAVYMSAKNVLRLVAP